MFEPHREQMKAKGFTPASLVEAWANVEKRLASGEDEAVSVLRGLQQGYNIPVAKIAAAFGFTQQRQQPATEQQPEHPQIQLPPELLNELNTLKQTVSGLTNAQRNAALAAQNAAGERAMREIEEFKSATDDKGTLLRPHFEEVENDMLALAQAKIAAKQPVPPLADLYETAVWANPSVRDKLLTARQQAEEQKRKDQEKAKSAAARKAAVSVSGAPGSGQAPAIRANVEKTLREQLEEAAADQAA
jgi:hypothetical protein